MTKTSEGGDMNAGIPSREVSEQVEFVLDGNDIQETSDSPPPAKVSQTETAQAPTQEEGTFQFLGEDGG